jgi:hypothetical protein
MSETEHSETEPKKMISGNVALALGVICIILATSFVGTTVYLVSAVNGKGSTINQNDSVIAKLNDIVHLQNHIVLVDSQSITQAADSYDSWSVPVNASGYIFVFTTSTNNDTYVRVNYTALPPGIVWETLSNGTVVDVFQDVWYNFTYDNQVNATSGGVVAGFPVLSSSTIPFSSNTTTTTDVEVRVGNTNLIGNTTQTVTIIYFY